MPKVLCIYHKDCTDGFGAAWAVRHALGRDNVEFHAASYDDPPPPVADRDVVVVDFSYKRPVFDEIARDARTVLVLDHHKTAADELRGLPVPPATYSALRDPATVSNPFRVCALFDMERSGAGLAWDYFHPDAQSRPDLINHIEDRDLWRFAAAGDTPDPGSPFQLSLRLRGLGRSHAHRYCRPAKGGRPIAAIASERCGPARSPDPAPYENWRF